MSLKQKNQHSNTIKLEVFTTRRSRFGFFFTYKIITFLKSFKSANMQKLNLYKQYLEEGFKI